MDDLLGKVLRLYVSIAVFLIAITVLAIVYRHLRYGEFNFGEFKTSREIAIEEQWDVYYNGQQVDIENIDLSLYNCSYDRDNKKVFIVDKTSSSSGAEGFGLLWFFIGRTFGR